MTEFHLTDDEIVAVAVDRAGAWVGGLPTVDTDDAEALAAAAFRGQRSLVARQLLNGKGELDAALSGLLAGAISSGDILTVYLGNDRLDRVSWGLATTHFRSAHWLLDAVAPTGIHRLAPEPIESHRSYLRGLLATAIDEGPQGPSGYLCVASVSPASRHVICARRGELGIAVQHESSEAWVTVAPLDISVLETVVEACLIQGLATI